MKKKHCCARRDSSPYRELTDAYICVGRQHRAVLERQLNRTGVYRGQHQLLMFISDNPKISQKEIARLCYVSAATVAVSLKKLEQGGYIRRVVDKQDNRYNQIYITEKGSAVVEKSLIIFRETERRMFSGFSREELAELQEYLNRIRKNLDEVLPEREKTESEELE